MNTISNERLEKMAAGGGFNFNEVEAISSELLALRKERERAAPVVVPDCFLNAVSALDSLYRNGQKQCWHERYTTDMAYASGVLNACRAAMLQSGNDEIGSWGNHKTTPTDKPKSEMSQQAEQLLRDTTALAATLSAEADTTAQQFESLALKSVVADENGNLPCPFCGGRCDPNGWMGSYDDGVPMCGPECEDCGATANSIEEWNRRSTALAGKAVVPEGWKLVPIELTKEMLKQIHPFAEATCLDCGNQVVAHCADNVTASWNDMLAVAPEPCK
ncbi:hypothetical protein ACM912_001627 [Cronobacter sakazakii]|uniref:hypothetical protein n=3 Tax=Cronobacter sakazakii TaxID=28141 RepID=UPI0015E2735F|nr:hypothetical protein [Cronobacter sakazakii]EKK4062106.1 hypothetical protein [Cronobacter sakazakii]ELY2527519.1 hypothetical protein [Cronobacter sakazakii]ELY3709441.1 hypothetical protein [Cronobacter sakazakii]ELY4541113.1 hypothetical protein [Cronobacter sakazakii]ELY4660504.1 hypothetical protein [Cronobacter sakazakii]